MTLDEAIKHYESKARHNEYLSNNYHRADYYDEAPTSEEFRNLANNYKQLVTWLNDLKESVQLLKIALDDMETLYEANKDEGCLGINFKWRYEDKVNRLIRNIEEIRGKM